jgi:GPH family glycoside/pentoside/hexuronide:cation symporter
VKKWIRKENQIKTNKWIPFLYGIGELGLSSIDIFIKVYLLVYFDLVKGLSLSMASLAIGLSVFCDAVVDPMIGRFSDHYYSIHGHRKNILTLAIFLMATSFCGVWLLPQATEWILFISLFLMSSVLNASLSLFSIPYIALANDLEPDNVRRKIWIGWRVVFFNLGSIVGLSTAAYFMSGEGAQKLQESYLWPVAILALVTVTTSFISVFSVYRKKTEKTEFVPKKQMVLSLKSIFSEGLFKKLLASFFIVYCGLGLNSTLALYYYRTYLNLAEKQIQIILVSFLVIFTLAIPLWVFLSKYVSQKKLIIAGGSMLGLSTMLIFPNLQGQSFLTIFLLASGLGGVLVGAAVILETYLSDFLNRSELQYKQSVSGQYLGLWKMAQKISRAVAVGLAGPILNLADQNAQMLANFFGYGVGSLFLISALIMAIPISEEND